MSLREQALRGGVYLVLRQVMGVTISLAGVFLLARLIGPTNYGLYSTAFVFVTFLSEVARMGVNIYLVRQENIPAETVYHQAFSFLILSGLSIASLSILISPLLGYWLEDSRFLDPLRVLLLLLPLTVISVPAMARLERALEYQKIASLELIGQLLYYAAALILAWGGGGVWAPIAGYFILQAWTVGACHILAHYRPRWHWSHELLRQMLGYGLGYSASMWIWQMRILVNPLIVGRYLGPESVGYVALAIRFVEALSFAKKAAWRLSVPVMAKVQHDPPRLRRALEEAMGLQALTQGPVLAGFALIAPWLLPLLFGDRWTPVLSVYPFIALSYLVNAVFSMHSSVLYVLQRNWAVAVFHLIHIMLFASAAALFVPRLGVIGYGLGEVVALSSYLVIHLNIRRLFNFSYGRTWPWLLAFVPPLFVPLIGFPGGAWLWVSVLALGFSGATRAQVEEYWHYVKKRKA